MTDTGQVPGEGLPENAGMVEQPGVPAPGTYTYLSDSAASPAEEEDLLLPGAQSAWGNEIAPPPPEPVVEAVHEPGPHEMAGRDSGSVDLGGVRLPDPPQSVPAAPRRPLHLGPPIPDLSAGPVRSLADRGPADLPARQAGPPTLGPEYLDVPRAREAAAPQAAAPWGAQATVSAGAAAAETVVPSPEPVTAAQAAVTRVATEAVAAQDTEGPAGEFGHGAPEVAAPHAVPATPVGAVDHTRPTAPAAEPGHAPGSEAPGAAAPGDVQTIEASIPGAAPSPETAVPQEAQGPEASQLPGAGPAADEYAHGTAAPQAEQVPGAEVAAGAATAGSVPVAEAAAPEDAQAPAAPGAEQVPGAEAAASVTVRMAEAFQAPAPAPGSVPSTQAAVPEHAHGPEASQAPTAEPAAAGYPQEPEVPQAAEPPGAEAAPAEHVEAAQASEDAQTPAQATVPSTEAAVPEHAEGTEEASGVPVPGEDAAAPEEPQGPAAAHAAQAPEAGATAPEHTQDTRMPQDSATPGPEAAAPAFAQGTEEASGVPVPGEDAATPEEPQGPAAAHAAQAPEAGATAPEHSQGARETQVPHGPGADALPETSAAQPDTTGPVAAAPAVVPGPDGMVEADTAQALPEPSEAVAPAPGTTGDEAPAGMPAEASVTPTRIQPPASVGPEEPHAPEGAVDAVAAEASAAVTEPVPGPDTGPSDPSTVTTAPETDTAPDTDTAPPAPSAPSAPATAEAHPMQGPQQTPTTPLPGTVPLVPDPDQPLGQFVPVDGTVPTTPHLAPTPPQGVTVQAAPDAEFAQSPDDLDTLGAGVEAEGEAQAEAPAEAAQPTGPAAPGYDDAEREAVLKVMRERRDIRNGFRSDPIPHEVLLRVLEAAHTAPSVGHSQPWDFVVIRSAETRRSMHELAMRQRDAYAQSLPKGRAKQFKELKIEAILDTPVNIVVTADPTRGGRHTLGRHTQPQMAPYSSALAVENLWLAARAEGLGVGWVSFFDEREMVRALGLPEHLEVVAYLCVGYVDEFPDEPELMQAGWSKRRPLSWVVHEETYGRRALPGEEPHDLLAETVAQIRPLDAKALGEAWERQKRMTKPAGALGMLEIISAQLSGLSRQCPPPIPEPAAVAIFAGDHGVHAQGVTPWPQEVTAQMVANFLGGGAVCNAFAAQVGAEVCVIDVGVSSDLPATPGLLPRKIRAGTSDMTTGPAMSREEVKKAIEVGIETARDLVAAGNKALLTGEMGIANTTASAALISVFTGSDPAEVTGRGTGINDETLARKTEVVRRALEVHQPDPADPIGVLAAVGGFEHAAMVGLLLGGASLRTPVILDGVSAGAAALAARAIAPEVLAACIAGHRSAEPGHVAALNKLGLRPLVDLDLRLGEGTGALLALPLVQSTARAMHEVATFDSAGVTEK
ncbi:nicotinate-nucleotide--dimethylbenzimidazole phosphoribosyltransferase [Streptomyces griseoloalbus]|uniref:nicotinate-nucleotide--dimethylbenzimidazole phosphoribosyltransferase n=1 Tax=Streptomyces griseoloalbus TaxID=67303 RepID=UPI0033BDD61E